MYREADCEAGERPDIALSSMDIFANLDEEFTLKAQEEREKDGDPVRTYTYTPASGAPVTGTEITFILNFSTENSLFMPQGFSLASATETEVLANLDSILPKPILVKNSFTREVNDYDSGLGADLTIELK
ncbi:MAG: hypothetical protein AB7T49_07205 [Oligoflexales bacterium]